MITQPELEKIEESSMQLVDKEAYIEIIYHMVVGGREGAIAAWDSNKNKYKGLLVFGYNKDVMRLAAEIRRLNGWEKQVELV